MCKKGTNGKTEINTRIMEEETKTPENEDKRKKYTKTKQKKQREWYRMGNQRKET